MQNEFLGGGLFQNLTFFVAVDIRKRRNFFNQLN